MSEGQPASLADARIAIGAQPISDAAPAGADIRRDPEFEAIEAEIRRMDADGPGAVRWPAVIEGAADVIANKSKDFLIGVWLTYGLAREEKWHGLAIGFSILRDMLDHYWEAMQPSVKRERARVGAAEWLVGRLVPLVADWQAEPANPAVLAAFVALDDVDRLMNERLTKENVAFGELVRAVRPHAEAVRRAAAEAVEREAREADRVKAAEAAAVDEAAPKIAAEPAVSAKPAPPPPPVATTAAPPVAVPAAPIAAPPAGGGPELDRAVSQLETSMRQHAEALRSANLFDPRSYILLRTATWLGIHQLPPQQGGRTMLPPPANDRVLAIETMRQAGNSDGAIRALESLLSSSPFFLDGQRMVHDALAGLGPQAEAAKAAVIQQVGAFARRLPGLEDLAFNDGRPFAAAATREWLASMANSSGGTESGVEEGEGDAAKAVLQLAGAGKLNDAFILLGDEIRHAGGGRARFTLQLLQAQICLEANLAAIAVPLVLGLARAMAEHHLEDWEPRLAARAAEITVRALTHAEAVKYVIEGERVAALQMARVRLAGLDPASAARLMK
jgi:type VI secretion system protein VasJ